MKKIVTFGEVLLRLTAPGNLRFSQVRDYVAAFGGSETNVAVSLANFGIPTEFVTRLPDNEIARACVSDLRSHGLRTDGIIYGGDRMGIYFLENGASFRNSKVVYDRAGIFLFLVRKWSDKAVLITAIILLLQPVEWFHYIASLFNPEYTLPNLGVGEMYGLVSLVGSCCCFVSKWS